MSTYDDYHRPQRASVWPLVLLLVLAGALIWRFWPKEPNTGLDPNATPRPVTARGTLSELEEATIQIYKQTAPAVVHVTRLAERRDPFTLNMQQLAAGTGSGFMWDEDGHIVTNNHVVAGADAFQVVLADHSRWKANVVGTDPDHDLAVLVITPPKSRLRPILIGTSHDLQVGQSAFAIGNPFGLDQTLTTGIVSALDREIVAQNDQSIKGAIQTNAAINPGNSGGPLLDSAGRLIGVNTAILSPSGASAGIGFAIPVDEVNRIVPDLIRHGRVVRPGLGVHVAKDQVNRQLGLDGVLIIDVIPDGPAAKAGLRPTRRDSNGRLQFGDVIVAIEGEPIRSTKDIYTITDKHKVGDTVKVTVEREEQRQDVPVTLEAM
jgi:S1-C subfamily serine protease